jgi:hypothetical protein
MTGRIQSVLPVCYERVYQRIRSLTGLACLVGRQRDSKCKGSIGRGGTSGHDRPDASDRGWVLTRIDRTLALWRPMSTSGASSQLLSSASFRRSDARARPISSDRHVRSLVCTCDFVSRPLAIVRLYFYVCTCGSNPTEQRGMTEHGHSVRSVRPACPVSATVATTCV